MQYIPGENVFAQNMAKVYPAPLQMELQGPRASLSSNYSSVLVTCRKVGGTNLVHKKVDNVDLFHISMQERVKIGEQVEQK